MLAFLKNILGFNKKKKKVYFLNQKTEGVGPRFSLPKRFKYLEFTVEDEVDFPDSITIQGSTSGIYWTVIGNILHTDKKKMVIYDLNIPFVRGVKIGSTGTAKVLMKVVK